jgi:hypothetical protein
MPCRDGIALKRAMVLIIMVVDRRGRVRSKEEIKLDVGKAAGFRSGDTRFLFDVVVAKDNADGEEGNQKSVE